MKSPQSLIFVRQLTGYLGWPFAVTSAIILVAALLEGIGIIMLVPLIEIVAGDGNSVWNERFDAAFASIGVTSDSGRLAVILGLFLCLMALRAGLVWLRNIRLQRHNLMFLDHLRERLVSAIAAAPWSRVPAHDHTDLEHSINVEIVRISSGTNQALRGMANATLLAGQVAAAFVISSALATWSILALGLVALIFLPLVRQAQKTGQMLTLRGRDVHAALGRFLLGLKLSKVHGVEPVFAQRYRTSLGYVRDRQMDFMRLQESTGLIYQFGGSVSVCIIIAVAVLVLETPLAAMAAFVVIFSRLNGLVLNTLRGVQSFANMLPAWQNVMEKERYFIAAAGQRDGAGDDIPARHQGAFGISLSHVTLAHDGESAPLLHDIDLEVAPGSFIALMGQSGAGKTSLLDIVSGLIVPTSGTARLTAGGESVSPALWRGSIAYVTQEAVFFDGTLRDNLTWLADDPSDEDVLAMLEHVEARALVERSEQGLDTRVGQFGQLFSGGERQRLSLARALLRRPGLLILDEALNAVDTRLEQRLLTMLSERKGEMTILMVTHRPPDHDGVDAVYGLADGKLFAETPHPS